MEEEKELSKSRISEDIYEKAPPDKNNESQNKSQ